MANSQDDYFVEDESVGDGRQHSYRPIDPLHDSVPDDEAHDEPWVLGNTVDDVILRDMYVQLQRRLIDEQRPSTDPPRLHFGPFRPSNDRPHQLASSTNPFVLIGTFFGVAFIVMGVVLGLCYLIYLWNDRRKRRRQAAAVQIYYVDDDVGSDEDDDLEPRILVNARRTVGNKDYGRID